MLFYHLIIIIFLKISNTLRPLSRLSIVAYSVMLTKMHYLFFLIVGHQMLTCASFVRQAFTQQHKPMTSQFDDRLCQNDDQF